jgi:hypothetical protein
MFTGLLFCGDCKEPLVRRVNHNKNGDKVLFICSTSNRGKGCFRHSIEENELKNIVLSALKQQLALYLDKTKVLASLENMEVHFDEVMSFDKELKELRKEQDKYSMLRSGLYEDLKQGIITADDFQNFKEIYDERYVKIQEAIEQQEQTIKDLFKAGVCAGAKLERMKSALTITELNRDVLITFVRRILLYDDKRIYVELNCKDMLSKLVMLEEYMDAVTEKQGKEAL